MDLTRARRADAELLLDAVLPAGRASRPRRSTSRSPSSSRPSASEMRATPIAAVEDVPALDTCQRGGAEPLEGLRRRRLRLLRQDARRARPRTRPRWKRCVVATDAALGQALGKSYVRDYFPPEAKAAADAMVRNLIAALRDDLATLPWMGEATRQKAIAKLATFRPKIGYPDVWRDYSAPHDRPRAVRPERRSAPTNSSSAASSPRSAGPSTARTGR